MADTVALMKKRVLDMAMHGELVKHSVNEANVDEIFPISTEKRLKQSESEKLLPFEIPINWKWVKLGDIGNWGAGATPARGNGLYWNNGNIPWLKTGELNNGEIWHSEEYITEKALKETSVKLNPPGSILIAMYGATIGKLGILNFEATTNQACCACTPVEGVYNRYLFYFLMSNKEKFIASSEGGAQPNISKTKIVDTAFPLPPLAEQKRIVTKIEKIFAVIEKIRTKKEEALSIIRNMRKAALQDAIMGLLVEQDEAAEPASVLYEKIQSEKDRLIKAREIKKEKPLPELNPEEIPFDIPEDWMWVRLGDVISLVSGRDLATSEFNQESRGIPYITGASNFNNGNLIINRWTETPKVVSVAGDLLVTVKGTVGEMLFQKEHEAHIARQIMAIRKLPETNLEYIKYFLDAELIKLKDKAKSMIPGVSREDILHFEFPLPPLAEQERIVGKLDEIMAMCDQMEAILDGSTDMVAERIY